MLVLYCFCVATEFSVNKDLYIAADTADAISSAGSEAGPSLSGAEVADNAF